MPRVPVSWLNEFLTPALTADDIDRLLGEAGIAVTAVVRPGAADPRIVVGRVEGPAATPDCRIVAVPTPEIVRTPDGPPQGATVAVALAGAWLFDPADRYGLARVPPPRHALQPVGVVCDGAALGLGAGLDPGSYLAAAGAELGAAVVGFLPPQPERLLMVTVPDVLVHATGLWGLAGELAPRAGGSRRVPEIAETAVSAAPGIFTVDCPGWTVAAAVVHADPAAGHLDQVRRWAVLAGLWSGRVLDDALRVTGHEYGVRLAAFSPTGTGPVAVAVGGPDPAEPPAGTPVGQLGWPTELLVGLSGGSGSGGGGSSGGGAGGSGGGGGGGGQLVLLAAARTEADDDGQRCRAAASRLAGLLGAGAVRPAVIAGPPAERRTVHIGLRALTGMLGTAVELTELRRLAARIGAGVAAGHGDRLAVAVPEGRPDLGSAEALMAEFVRLLGYRRLPATVPTDPVPALLADDWGRPERARAAVVARGYQEVVTAFVVAQRPGRPGWFAPARALRTADGHGGARLVRRSLLPGIEAAFAARPVEWADGAAFELGTVVRPDLSGAECEGLALALVRVGEAVTVEGRCADVASAVTAALRAAGCADVDLVPVTPGEAVVESIAGGDLIVHVVGAGHVLGHIGVLGGFGAGQLAAYAEVQLGPVLARPAHPAVVEVRPSRPATILDVTVVVPDELSTGQLLRGLDDGTALLRSTRVVAVYRGPTVLGGHRAVTLRMEFASPWRTVATAEARHAGERAVAAIEHLGVRRR